MRVLFFIRVHNGCLNYKSVACWLENFKHMYMNTQVFHDAAHMYFSTFSLI